MFDDFEQDDEENIIQEELSEEDYEDRISRYRGQRSLQQKQMERRVRRSRLWLNRLRYLLRFVIIIGLVFVSLKLLNMSKWYMNPNAFDSVENDSLEIVNNRIVPSFKVLLALRGHSVPTGPIYMADTEALRRSIMQLDPVQNVFIRRFWWPARFQILIQERIPVLTIAPSPDVEPIAFFATGGKLIGREYMPLDPSFETYKVLSYGVRGDDYRNWDNEKIKQIEKLAKAIEYYSKEKIEYLDYRVPNDIYVCLQTAIIRLGKIDDNVYSRIKYLPSILPQVKMLDKTIKYVDLRWDDPVIKME